MFELKTTFFPLLLVLWMEFVTAVTQGCEKWEFRCQSSGTCLKVTGRCNGKIECTDGSDELRCPHNGETTSKWTVPPCTSGQFHCGNGRCVYNKWICDGENDCGDGSDEFGCAQNASNQSDLSLGAVVGISLACSVVLLLLILTIIYMLYHRIKTQRRRRTPDPIQEITDIMGGVPYHMPREALLRVPPPQYTSQVNLAQENAGFIIDEVLTRDQQPKPPPLYSSRPDLTLAVHQSCSDLPPMYSSRQNLHEVGLSSESQQNCQIPISHSSIRTTDRNLGINNPRLQALRRPRGRVTRVRESIPVLSTLATFARSSLNRSRSSSRRNSNRRRRSNSSNHSPFSYSKPRAIRQQQQEQNFVRPCQTRIPPEGAEVDIDRGYVTMNNISLQNDQFSQTETATVVQYFESSDSTVPQDMNQEDEKVQDKFIVPNSDTDKRIVPVNDKRKVKESNLLNAQMLTSKCKSVPDLAIQMTKNATDGIITLSLKSEKQDSVISTNVKILKETRPTSASRGQTFNGKKSRSLNYLLDAEFTLMESHPELRHSLTSLDSCTC